MSRVRIKTAATQRGMLISIPMRVEDPRQRSWLVDVPDVALTEVAELIESAPEARFLLLNGLGYVNTPLDRRRFLVGSTAAGIGLALHSGAVAASGTSAELELS